MRTWLAAYQAHRGCTVHSCNAALTKAPYKDTRAPPAQTSSGPGSFSLAQERQEPIQSGFILSHLKDGKALVHSTFITHKSERETFAQTVS